MAEGEEAINSRGYLLFGHCLKAPNVAYQSIKDKSAYYKLQNELSCTRLFPNIIPPSL
jgi:hypothetical protein